ncbi:rhodanese-like domain-containing protein [Specibacter sp. AOP5-B1-6]|uniref:rhodanese-like domain-containing protein n=1 Tax=Specibacter sp. AOP5-B1-6 TaxID=3457653 RepID=UPI00402B6EC3
MQEITAADILAADPDVQIIDVREASELPTGMIEDAVHIPSGSVLERADELDKSRRVIAVCHGGGRSGRVAEALTGLGFNADTLVGGMSGWEAQGLPMVPPQQ